MVYGIGCDLCSIARMEKSLLGPHGAVFARRVFGPAEQAALGLPLACLLYTSPSPRDS